MSTQNKILFRKGTESAWTSINPILGSGEPGYDLTNKILKIGDGSSSWSQLEEVAPANIVRTTGNQSISGIKTFNDSITASGFIKSGGTSNEFLKADGSVDSTTYQTQISSLSFFYVSEFDGQYVNSDDSLNDVLISIDNSFINLYNDNTFVRTTGNQSVSGQKTFNSNVNIDGAEYGGIGSLSFVGQQGGVISFDNTGYKYIDGTSNNLVIGNDYLNNYIEVAASAIKLNGDTQVKAANTVGNNIGYFAVFDSNPAISLTTLKSVSKDQILDDIGAATSGLNITAGSGLVGGGTLSQNRTFDIGQGDGISVGADSVAVNSTVVRTTGNQSVSGVKTFNNISINGNYVGGASFVPLYLQATDNSYAQPVMMIEQGPNAILDIRNDGNIAIGYRAMGYNARFSIAGKTSDASASALDVFSSGSSSYLFRVRNDGNVGIRTGAPTAQLHVVGSGIFASGLSVSGLLTSNSGNFNNLTVNNIPVSLTTHTHSSFSNLSINSSTFSNTALSIVVPAGGTTIDYEDNSSLEIVNLEEASTVFRIDGYGRIAIGSIYTSNIPDFGTAVTDLLPTVANSGNNRILTSTGSSVGVNGESNLTFDGNLLSVTGSGLFSNTITSSGFVRNVVGVLANDVLLAGGSSTPQAGLSVGSASTANAATNLNGGLAGSIPYQSNISTTAFVGIGSNGQFLTSNGSAPVWTSNPVTGTGIANHIPYWSSTSGLLADSNQLIWDSTNNRLGIGVSSPSVSLEIGGDLNVGYSNENINRAVTIHSSNVSNKCGKIRHDGSSLIIDYLIANQSLLLGTSTNRWINGIAYYGGSHLFYGNNGSNTILTINSSTSGVSIGSGYNVNTPTNGLIVEGNVGIGTTSPGYKLQVAGSFGATTKSFRIDHPSKPGWSLEYGSLESPYHGVRLTGRGKVIKGVGTVDLPDYLKDLIHDDESITIQLTNYKHGKTLYVDKIDLKNDRFVVKVDRAKTLGELEFFWTLTGVRKDVEDLVVEKRN